MPPGPLGLDADDARSWALLTRAALASRRAELDELNVFPVPDGDTGTNLYLTVDHALSDVVARHESLGIVGTASLTQECRTLADAVVLTGRGNSGIIVGQLVAGFCTRVADTGVDTVGAPLLAEAMAHGARLARAAVGEPREGTILTVLDSAVAAGRDEADRGGDLSETVAAMVTAARAALARTPEQLPVLAEAGVVDAGGAGAVLLLEALARVVAEGAGVPDLLDGGLSRREEWRVTPVTHADHPDALEQPAHPADLPYAGPGYEVMYLLSETTPERMAELRDALASLGDSLVVIGGPEVWNVHVHVDDAGAAVEAGLAAGRPHRISVTYLRAPAGHAAAGGCATTGATEPASVKIGVVACAAGPGIAATLTEGGAGVVASGPGVRASAGELLAAIRSRGTPEVLVLPNDKDTVLAAGQARDAAAAEGIAVTVIDTRTVVQGLAALAVWDPALSLTANAIAMSGAAAAVSHGGVTVAVREALTWAGPCLPGDVLGIVGGDFVVIGTALDDVASDVLTRLLSAGGELVTLIGGADLDPEDLVAVQRWLRREHGEVDVVVIDGQQPHYPLLIGVE